jgi:hypothetical protein
MISASGIPTPVVADLPSVQVNNDQPLPPSSDRNAPALNSGALVVEVIGKIVAMSQRLFPGPVSIDYSYDPENPSDEYLIFDVVANGEYAEYRERIFQWHEEIRRIVPGSLGEFTLSVTPRR